MFRTTVMLSEADKRALEQLSALTGTSEAELIRQGVRHVLQTAPRPRPRGALFSSSADDGLSAVDTDELLRLTGFGES